MRIGPMSMLLVAGLLSASCQKAVIWSGVQYLEDGRIQLASEEPQCGCLTLINTSSMPITLTASYHGTRTGKVVLQPGERLSTRYDWAGAENDDVYILDGTGRNGEHVDLRKTVQFEGQDRIQDCATIECELGDLNMNVGVIGQ